MSPQSTLTPDRRQVRRIPTGVLDLTHDFHHDFTHDFTHDLTRPARRPRPLPQRKLPKTDLMPPVVISFAPPFERAAPLQLVEFAPSRSGTRRPAKSLTAGHIRLTRRGRLALLMAAVACMLFGFLLGDALSFKGATIKPPATSHSIVVQPGQTLWGIASQVAPHADPRATVQQIILLNHLASTGVEAGQSLAVPS